MRGDWTKGLSGNKLPVPGRLLPDESRAAVRRFSRRMEMGEPDGAALVRTRKIVKKKEKEVAPLITGDPEAPMSHQPGIDSIETGRIYGCSESITHFSFPRMSICIYLPRFSIVD